MKQTTQSDTNGKKRNLAPLLWAGFYVILLSLINILLAFLISHLSISLIIIILAIMVILTMYAWHQPFQNKILHLHSILNMIGGVTLGIAVAHFFSENTLMSFLFAFAVMDFIIFTKLGKYTPHRKLFESKVFLKRLSICMSIPKHSGLFPIIGIGDMFFYALIVGATFKIWSTSSIWIAIIAIVFGQIMNMTCMLFFKDKPWYRGIPATLLPALIFIIIILVK